MSGRDDTRILNHATSQADRQQGAPAPEQVDVDGRSLAQLLAFAARYGALIRFYGIDNAPNGDWEAMFASDPAVLDALHASLNLTEIERMLKSLLDDARSAIDQPGRLEPLERVLIVIVRLLDVLHRSHIEWPSIEAALQRYAPDRRSDGLGPPLKRLRGHLGGRTLADRLSNDPDAGRDGTWHGTLIEILDDLAAMLIDALLSGVAAAQVKLEQSLATAGHAPQNAVYNAFVKLFIQSREELNKIPRRLVDFYYHDVLEQQAVAATPDQTFLTFTCASGVDQASVPRGALFPAGTDSDGVAILYAATSPLEVTPAAVAEISVHRVTRTKAGENTGVLAGQVELNTSNPTAATPFPMFGADPGEPPGALTMTPAKLGFCVASPVLMLRGGRRTVKIGLLVSLIDSPVADPDSSGDPASCAPTEALPAGDVDGLVNVLEKTLELHYSTAGGWMLVEGISVVPAVHLEAGKQGMLYTIIFQLPADAPPVVAVAEKPRADAPKPTRPASAFIEQPKQPAVIASLNLAGEAQQATAFAILSRIAFDHIYLDVMVEGLDQLTLTTPNGPADTSQDFPVFGLPPAQHSTLDIYAPELFVKPVERLSVSIRWAGLPVTSTGFQGYYQNYTLDADGLPAQTPPLFDNGSFHIAFGVANPGHWDVAGNTQPYLFQTGPDPATPPPSIDDPCLDIAPVAAAPVRRTSWLDVPGLSACQPPTYYNAAKSTLRLSLAAPAYAFGNILYSSNLMAASMKQTQAALDQASQDQRDRCDAQAQVANLAKVNATAPDAGYAASVSGAVHSAVSSLAGEAVAAVQQGVAQSKAAPETKAWWLTDLENAIAAVAGRKGSLWERLTGRGGVAADVAALVERIKAWIAEHEAALGEHAAPEIGRAQGLLAAAGTVASTHSATAGQPPAVTRPAVAAAAQQAQVVVLPSLLPNPPWLPMASALAISYRCSVDSSIDAIDGNAAQSADGVTFQPLVSGAADGDTLSLDFWHIGPFGVRSRPSPDSSGSVGILPTVEGHGALYIKLSVPVAQVSLLFVLVAGANGWWDDPPAMFWEEHIGGQWKSCRVLGDTTQGLKSSGIVTLALTVVPGATSAPRLRVRAHGRTENAPTVQCIIANALTVEWQEPGGAAELGTPMLAGTITKSQDKLPGIASVAQPIESFGGAPPAAGAAFQMWMAEQLRHKSFAIDEWDHARIALAAVPSLWQAAVVPAVNAATGERAPGKVWVVAVAGPDTPNIPDKTIPQVDLAVLSEIGDTLSARTSSFAQIVVTNPPYMRLGVTAEVEFSADDTPAYWEDQLNNDLIEWLSPWPPSEALGPRPKDYYTRRAIAEFIRSRSYVLGISSLRVVPVPVAPGNGYYYLTSATRHSITTLTTGTLDIPPASELFPAGDFA